MLEPNNGVERLSPWTGSLCSFVSMWYNALVPFLSYSCFLLTFNGSFWLPIKKKKSESIRKQQESWVMTKKAKKNYACLDVAWFQLSLKTLFKWNGEFLFSDLFSVIFIPIALSPFEDHYSLNKPSWAKWTRPWARLELEPSSGMAWDKPMSVINELSLS